jgi:hypothetical protein
MFEPPAPATTRYEIVHVSPDETKFIVSFPGTRYELTFTEPVRVLRRVTVSPDGEMPGRRAEMVITSMTFPESVADQAFHMEAK